MLKWIVRVALGLVALAVLAVAGVYGASEVILRRTGEAPMPVIVASTDAGAVARGAHLGRTLGCDGCHARNLQGDAMIDDPVLARLYAPNLTRAIVDYSDPELARAIRAGIRPDGDELWIMPAQSLANLSDTDTADIIAWLRSHPAAGEKSPGLRVGPMGRLGILTGEFHSAPHALAEARKTRLFDAGPGLARGQYIAAIACTECHGGDLGGAGPEGDAPNLTIAAGYDLPGFTRLMRTGIAADGKEKGLMSEVSRDNFSAFTDGEIAELHAYLVARAERMPPPD